MNAFPVSWLAGRDILTVPSKRSLGSVCERIRDSNPAWIVIRRTRDALTPFSPYFYAFRPEELLAVDRDFPHWRERPIEEALDLHEHGSSTASSGQVPREVDRAGDSGPASWRVVHLGMDAEPVAIGTMYQPEAAAAPAAPPMADLDVPEAFDLGPTRGGSGRERRTRSGGGARRGGRDVRRMESSDAESARAAPESPARPAESMTVTISADAERRIICGNSTHVIFQIELEGEAAPLQERFSAEVTRTENIHVILSTDSEALEVVGERIQQVAPPTSGKPTRGSFEVKAPNLPIATEPNVARLALLFRQGATELGQIAFSVMIVRSATEPPPERARASVEAAPRDRRDDEVLVLLIEQEPHGDGICYEYRLHSETLGLNYLTLKSAPLQDRGGGAAASTQAYVEAIYDRVTQDVLSRDDANRLQREVRALGTSMCSELFDPEVTRQIWPHRKQIRTVQIVSWEPYIPWELLRLRHPDTDELDDRFLCEYGLIRSMPGIATPRRLRLGDWHYLAAHYPNGLEAAVGGEVDYFTESLPARGIYPVSISPSYDAFFDALESGGFDVLHIACHGESEHGHIENSTLIIGDEPGPDGQPRPLQVDAVTVQQEARLKDRRPLIFLNACESGRHGPSLTAWGGWPSAFLRAGAGAFVGTSWPVREKPARLFAHTFYDALLDGETLSFAAAAARKATRDLGDASWLAFKVYGHPRAQLN